MAMDWAARRWAMVLLPLPADSLEAVRLLIHEVWHAVQRAALPVAAPNEAGVVGGDLLDGPDGRLWLQLEWRALAEALQATGAAQDRALLASPAFRARRYSTASPEERLRELLLDVHEGLADYPAWRVTRSDPRDLAERLRTEAPRRRSYVRSFAYFTGPAYGLLLDARLPGWTRRFPCAPNLQLAALSTLRRPPAYLRPWPEGTCCDGMGDLERLAEREGRRRGLASLRARERSRWREHVATLQSAQAPFVDGPTLRLRPGALNVVFDPNGQLSLGEAGTVMGGLQWRSADGTAELSAPAGRSSRPTGRSSGYPWDGPDCGKGHSRLRRRGKATAGRCGSRPAGTSAGTARRGSRGLLNGRSSRPGPVHAAPGTSLFTSPFHRPSRSAHVPA